MTAPIEFDSILPYAIRFKMGAGSYMVPEEGQRSTGWVYTLPAGAYQIQLAYTGPEAAEVWWRPDGGNASTIEMCQIPAEPTGTPRNSKPLIIQANGKGTLAITTTPRPNAGAQSTSTASLHIYPMST